MSCHLQEIFEEKKILNEMTYSVSHHKLLLGELMHVKL